MNNPVSAPIGGTVSPGYEPVAEQFSKLWQTDEIGASLCAFVDGEKVVDLWGGFAGPDEEAHWQQDTIVNAYSCTKGVTSLALALLHQSGELDYGARVSRYWPDFRQQDKQDVTVAQLLSHQAGLCGIEETLTIDDLYDWDKMTTLLARQRPLWPPGTACGYHSITWGFLAGELIRRLSSLMPGRFIDEAICTPLNLDFHIGLPEAEFARVAMLNGPNRARSPRPPAAGSKPAPMSALATQNPVIRPFKDVPTARWRRADIPSANGHGNARSLATLYAALAVTAPDLISRESLEAAIKPEVIRQQDLVLGREMSFARGFMLNAGEFFGPNPDAFGHDGAGGSIAFVDRDNQLAVSYVMNQMLSRDHGPGSRSHTLTKVIYECANIIL